MRMLRGGGVGFRDWLAVEAFVSGGAGKGILEGRLDAIRYEGLRGLFLKG